MQVKYLDWDSNFFNLKIGRVELFNSDDIDKFYSLVGNLKGDYNLIYIFNHTTSDIENTLLVDEKVIYQKYVETKVSYNEVSLYDKIIPNEDLYRLALVSGKHSRYNIDPNWPQGSYERLYKRWIEQSANGNLANCIFIFKNNDIINGMITAKWKENNADIGLVAVDTEVQGKNIGTKLMSSLENYLSSQTTVKELRVATQYSNKQACAWYEKNGFQIESVTRIHHLWL